MKKVFTVLSVLFFLVLSFNSKAQTAPSKDYFIGKWDMLIENLPQGDPKMIVSLERKNNLLQGTVLDSAQNEIAKITKVDEAEKTVTVYFSAQGYDVTLEMTKKDDDHITGSLMNMFDAKGTRMKETK